MIVSHLPEGPPLYPDGELTDEPEQIMIAELVREAALEGVRDELPHSLAVVVEEMVARPDRPADDPLLDVHVWLYVERRSQKGIVIGRSGARLREVGIAARQQIEALLGQRVHLDLRVKVAKDWQRDPKQLHGSGSDRAWPSSATAGAQPVRRRPGADHDRLARVVQADVHGLVRSSSKSSKSPSGTGPAAPRNHALSASDASSRAIPATRASAVQESAVVGRRVQGEAGVAPQVGEALAPTMPAITSPALEEAQLGPAQPGRAVGAQRRHHVDGYARGSDPPRRPRAWVRTC